MIRNDHSKDIDKAVLAALGSSHLAYMRKTTHEELAIAFPEALSLPGEGPCWALFAADGSLLAIAQNRHDLAANALEHDLFAVLPN